MTSHRRRRLALFMIVAIALTAAEATAVPRARAHEATMTASDEVPAIVDIRGIPHVLQSMLGEQYGYTMIDPSDASRIIVGLVDASPIQRVLVSALGTARAKGITFAAAKSSKAAMKRYKDAVSNLLRDAAIHDYSLGLNEVKQKIVLQVSGLPSAVERSIRSAVPADLLEISVGYAPRIVPTHTDRSDPLPYDAGLFVGFQNAPSGCTTGYMLYAGTTTEEYYGTTAGHCANTNDTVYIGGFVTGIGTNSLGPNWFADSDSSRYYIQEEDKTNLIYTGGSGHRIVIGKLTNEDLVPGLSLCFQGIASDNNNCGQIQVGQADIEKNLTGTGHTLLHAWCINFDSIGGDSGGPVYQVIANGALAAGLVTGGLDITGTGEAGPMCFSSIDYVEQDLNATLYTG